jgi:HEAT repeat protein
MSWIETALQAALADLTHDDPRRRLDAAGTLGDLVGGTGRHLEEAAAEEVVARLVAHFVGEDDLDVQEATLNAIGYAFMHHRPGLHLFEPLRPLLAAMPPALLDYALDILSSTHDPSIRPTIEAFLQHPDPDVRRCAAEALVELRGRSP